MSSLARGRAGEAALTLAGTYFVHFVLTRVAVATVAPLSVVRPIKGLAAWLFVGWDAEHYLRLAENYDSFAWPPLYPLVLRAVAGVGLSIPAAAVLVNLAAHGAIVSLAGAYVRGSTRLQDVPGWLFGALLLFFPGHNVFFAAYSESLFLALALGACVAWQREQWLLVGLLCGAAVLTRNMGVFLGLAFLLVEVSRVLRERRAWGRLLAIGAWVPVFIAWNVWLSTVAGTDPVAATDEWQQELLSVHVPAGANPKLWVLGFVAFPPGNHDEFVFFWGLVIAAAWAWRRGMRVESLYVVLFLLSFAVYLYRPFPFTRYVSTLFPLTLMVASATRRRPVLQAFTLAASVALSHHYEVMLFSDRFGEP